jgi:hypothetical protein
MKKEEDVIQERLARLEAGESLEVCLSELAEDQAQVLLVAAELRGLAFSQAETIVSAQRTALLKMAARELQGNPQKRGEAADLLSPWSKFQQQLGLIFAQRRAVVALVAILMVALFAGLWATQSGREDGDSVAVESTGRPGQATSPIERSGPDEVASLPAAPPEEAASSEAVNTVFVPVLTSPLNQTPQQAVLQDIRGLVEVQGEDGSWSAVSQVALLRAGQRVRSGSLSSARLLFYDGSQARIGAKSELSIDELDALRPEQGFRTVVLSQQLGQTEHRVRFRNDAGSRYQVKTPTGSGIARGTSFRVQVGQDAQASYLVTEGRVEVSSASQTVLVVAGQMTSFAENEPPAQPEFLVDGEGIVTQVGETWIIDGQRFAVDGNTLISGDPQVGDLVHVEGTLQSGDLPRANLIELLQESPIDAFSLTGQVDEIGATSWRIAGQEIAITPDTLIGPGIGEGDMVRVTGTIAPAGGGLVATVISLLEADHGRPFEFAGIVQTMGDDTWGISGIAVTINDDTEIDREIRVGDTVKVEGFILEDDTWLAEEIKLLRQGEATFAFTGQVRTRDPWLVGDISFEVRDWTFIEADIEIGDWVRVSGTILEDGTWVAGSIVRLDDELLQLVFVGTVDSIDPWVISGLPIATDQETEIDEAIIEGDLVRVTVWILADGSWLASSIERLSQDGDDGCVAITAVITAINGDQIRLNDGQTIILGDDAIVTGELQVGSVVVIIACVNEDGSIDILSITVIYDPADEPPPPSDDGDRERVTICHKPDTPAEKTMSLPRAALSGHLGHGDFLGSCP